MAGLVPAIGRGTLPLRMAGTSPTMTARAGTVGAGFIQGGSANGRCGTRNDRAQVASPARHAPDRNQQMKHMALALMLIAAPALGATRTDTTVAFYHGEPERSGNYIVPGLNWQSVGAVRRDQTFRWTCRWTYLRATTVLAPVRLGTRTDHSSDRRRPCLRVGRSNRAHRVALQPRPCGSSCRTALRQHRPTRRHGNAGDRYFARRGLPRCDGRRPRHAAAPRLWPAACGRQRAARLSDRCCRWARGARHQFRPGRAGPARRACTAEWPDLRPVRRTFRRLRRLSWRGRRCLASIRRGFSAPG